MQPSTHARGEVLVPLRVADGRVALATRARTTLLASSLLGLRERGHFERYLSLLPSSLHDVILHSVAGEWLRIETIVAHYRAADALGLPVEEQFQLGCASADRVQNSLLGTLARVTKGVGVTPWIGLEYFQRLWDRMLQGGSGAVYALGPKEARVEAHGLPQLPGIAYFRNGWRGMFAGSCRLFCNKVYVTEIRALTTATTLGFRVAWA
jgi:hypothetical protein